MCCSCKQGILLLLIGRFIDHRYLLISASLLVCLSLSSTNWGHGAEGVLWGATRSMCKRRVVVFGINLMCVPVVQGDLGDGGITHLKAPTSRGAVIAGTAAGKVLMVDPRKQLKVSEHCGSYMAG